jgi:hypothetical protein
MWSPLRRPVFRAVWIAWVVSSTGNWMQIAGAVWVMTSLTPSPLLVALMQTARSLLIILREGYEQTIQAVRDFLQAH